MTASKNTKKKASGSSNSASNFSNLKAPKKDEKRKSSIDDPSGDSLTKSTPLKDAKETSKVPTVDPDQDEHPLKNSNFLVVKYRDGSHRIAKIIEKNSKVVEKKTVWQYYVHYSDFNRRMDEWVSTERIVLLPSAANPLAAEHAAAHAHAHGHGAGDDKKAHAGNTLFQNRIISIHLNMFVLRAHLSA